MPQLSGVPISHPPMALLSTILGYQHVSNGKETKEGIPPLRAGRLMWLIFLCAWWRMPRLAVNRNFHDYVITFVQWKSLLVCKVCFPISYACLSCLTTSALTKASHRAETARIRIKANAASSRQTQWVIHRQTTAQEYTCTCSFVWVNHWYAICP